MMFWIAVILLLAILVLVGLLMFQGRRLKRLQAAQHQLDEQAKLMIKTDIALHRTHEELDKKIAGLLALHDWGQRTRVLAEPEKLLAQFDTSFVRRLGYDKGFLLFRDRETGQMRWSFFGGYSDDGRSQLDQFFQRSSDWWRLVDEGRSLLLNQPDATPGFEYDLLRACQCTSIIVVSLPLKDATLRGVVCMGHEGLYEHVTSGDHDLLAILATQLATDLENARLYEQVWEAVLREVNVWRVRPSQISCPAGESTYELTFKRHGKRQVLIECESSLPNSRLVRVIKILSIAAAAFLSRDR